MILSGGDTTKSRAFRYVSYRSSGTTMAITLFGKALLLQLFGPLFKLVCRFDLAQSGIRTWLRSWSAGRTSRGHRAQ